MLFYVVDFFSPHPKRGGEGYWGGCLSKSVMGRENEYANNINL